MKKFLFVILMIALIGALLTGCGKNGESSNKSINDAGTSATDTSKKDLLKGAGILVHSIEGKDEDRKLIVKSVDPVTGKTETIRSFPIGNYGSACLSYGSNYSLDHNYERLAVETTEPGFSHVGWIDQDRNFTDVTLKIGCDTENYLYYRGMFDANDNFYFGRSPLKANNYSVLKLKDGSLKNQAELIVEDNNGMLCTYRLNPDGSVRSGSQVMYSDAFMKYWAIGEEYVLDWIDEKTYIYLIGSELFLCDAYTDDPSRYDNLLALEPLNKRNIIDNSKYKYVFSAKASPDGSQIVCWVAESSNYGPYKLLVVPSTGGMPVEVPITDTYDLLFSTDKKLVFGLGWR